MRTLTGPAEAEIKIGGRAAHRIKLGAFVTGLAVAAGILRALSLILAYVLREGQLFCGPGLDPCADAEPYLAVVPFAAGIGAAVALRRRAWRQRRVAGYFDEVMEAIRDGTLGSVLLVVVTFLFRSGFRFQDFSYSRGVFFLDWVLATAGLLVLAVAVKASMCWLRRRGNNQRSVVIVGSGELARVLEAHVERHPETGYRIVGRVEQDDRAPIQEELLRISRARRVDEVVVAREIDGKQLSQLVGVAELARLEIKAVPELFGLPPAKVSLDSLGRLPVLALLQEPLPGGRRAAKEVLDVVTGSMTLVLASPLLVLIAVVIRLTSPGPVLLRQERVGMDGRPFAMLKFRTMVEGADPSVHEEFVASFISGEEDSTGGSPPDGVRKLCDDHRVTPVGRILRRLSLDELPQLFNVLRGEMSLVGPRPALPFEVALYEDWHRRRLEVRPGISGLWQVSGRGKLGFDDMVRLDIQYIERWSPLLDILIVLRTPLAILRRETR